MRLYYRISDKGYPKQKLPGADKEYCLMNFCAAFQNQVFGILRNDKMRGGLLHCPPLLVIADRCEDDTYKMIADTGLAVQRTDLGNAKSLLHTLERAAKENEDDEILYFCEDDYLHIQTAPKLLEEGLKRSDYVTLYDHPDKYTRLYNGGEFSKVIKTESSHWRFTVSTCMTFGTTAKVLREDLDVFRKHCEGDHPHDHFIFEELGKKGRRLAVPIPGAACHTDLTFSANMKQVLIDPWAIDMMIGRVDIQLNGVHATDNFMPPKEYVEMREMLLKRAKTPWEKLFALDVLKKEYLK